MSLVAAHQFTPHELAIPASIPRIAEHLDRWQAGSVHLLETDTPKILHQDIHRVMIDAYQADWRVTLIDGANCFNPHFMDVETTKRGLDTQAVLRSIKLARPFQMLQTVALIEKAHETLCNQDPDHSMVVVTGLSDCFFDPRAATGRKQDEARSVQLLQQAAATLQRISVHGSTVIITDRIREQRSLVSFAAKIHMRFERMDDEWEIQLLTHPYKSATQSNRRVVHTPQRSPNQLSIDDFF